MARLVAYLAQLSPHQKLAVLLVVYGFSAAPLLFWISWRVFAKLREKKVAYSFFFFCIFSQVLHNSTLLMLLSLKDCSTAGQQEMCCS